jgi:hypothetical protein
MSEFDAELQAKVLTLSWIATSGINPNKFRNVYKRFIGAALNETLEAIVRSEESDSRPAFPYYDPITRRVDNSYSACPLPGGGYEKVPFLTGNAQSKLILLKLPHKVRKSITKYFC